jgi:hypothetical protein
VTGSRTPHEVQLDDDSLRGPRARTSRERSSPQASENARCPAVSYRDSAPLKLLGPRSWRLAFRIRARAPHERSRPSRSASGVGSPAAARGRRAARQAVPVAPCEETAISDAFLESLRRPSHYRRSFRAYGRNWRRPGVWAGDLRVKKGDFLCRVFCSACSLAWQREQSVMRSASALEPATAW